MSEFVVRPVVEGEERATSEVLGQALHMHVTDALWERWRCAFQVDRKFAALADGKPIGVASSFATKLAVPGGKSLPTAAVEGIGVRPDHTRRGVLTALMHKQLRDCVRRGEILATLHASETTIYGRFGYGVATRHKTVRIRRDMAKFHSNAPRGGAVRLLENGTAIDQIPQLYQRIGLHRPGMIDRLEVWRQLSYDEMIREYLIAVHTGSNGDDGFLLYRPVSLRSLKEPSGGTVLHVGDMHAANASALAGLWRFLLNVDLASEVLAPGRPLDEPIGAMLADPRVCEVLAIEDHTWLRLLDVPAALKARSYRSAEPIVIDVMDKLLPFNEGRYRISSDGVERTNLPAQLRLNINALAMIYLGEWRATTLAAVGRIDALDPASLPRADELFYTPTSPWCGTQF